MGLYSDRRGSRSKIGGQLANYLVTGGGLHRFAGEIYNIGCERGISVNQLVGHVNEALARLSTRFAKNRDRVM